MSNTNNDLRFERVDILNSRFRDTLEERDRCIRLCYDINSTEPLTERSTSLIKALFSKGLDPTSIVMPPMQIDLGTNITIGCHVFIDHSVICTAGGGITIEDNVRIGAGVYLLSEDNDPDDPAIPRSATIVIQKNARIGAGSIILPGVTIGEGVVVRAGSVVSESILL